jgi:hypothetical protein
MLLTVTSILSVWPFLKQAVVVQISFLGLAKYIFLSHLNKMCCENLFKAKGTHDNCNLATHRPPEKNKTPQRAPLLKDTTDSLHRCVFMPEVTGYFSWWHYGGGE